jgi:CBS domain-containing protein
MKRVAKDIMNPRVITMSNTMSLREVANIFMHEGITGAPVLDELGHLVGVISRTDLVAYELAEEQEITAEPSFYHRPFDHVPAFRAGFSKQEPRPDTVQDAMTSMLITVEEETPIPDVAARMVQSRIHRLLVVDTDEQLQGIITSLDVLRWVAEDVRFEAELSRGRRTEEGLWNSL